MSNAIELLCRQLRDRYQLAVITNDIYTFKDQKILTKAAALPPERIRGIQTGDCPHTAIREDSSLNQEVSVDHQSPYYLEKNSGLSVTITTDQSIQPGEYWLYFDHQRGNYQSDGAIGLSIEPTPSVPEPEPPTPVPEPEPEPPAPTPEPQPPTPIPEPEPPTPEPDHPRFPNGFQPPCVSPHRIKGNVSKEWIYHLPGGTYYNRTNPEVCYITESDARADGFRRSSR